MKRSEGEKVRLRHAIERIRTTLTSIEHGIATNTVGLEDAQTLLQTAGEIAMGLARMVAYEIVERES